MPNGKTIRQIADEIGVTRQAVYQKIKSNPSTVNSLKLYTFTVDSVKYYTSEGEALIKSLFSGKSAVKQAVNEGVKLSTESVYTPVNEFTANLTDLFTAQLKEKDKQIAEKDKQLAEKDTQIAALTAMLQSAQEQQAALVQTLAAEQALAAADKQQLLLQAENQSEQPEKAQKQETAKKGFFSRIFGK